MPDGELIKAIVDVPLNPIPVLLKLRFGELSLIFP
jgi:hypothetical protein